MSTEFQRTCSICGNAFFGAMEFCPVCMLRNALAGGIEAEDFISEDAVKPAPGHPVQRFENYQLLPGEDGMPVELGRGAMGVTYKAQDVDLRCPVTLKVINKRYLGDESARLRFLREARAAASVRHPNVASVLHLGRTGTGYFYAMEFVDGETLDHLIKRSGRVEAMLALEITRQAAAGLAAVHKQNLIHRDIKPSNIMVSFDEESEPLVKIIDLGLAKLTTDSPGEAAISVPGVFAGTPEFASPEQFAGVPVDIRSDLYSLGVTLWAMLTGKAPFRGTAAEAMYQHQHAPLPLEQLEHVPQPVVALLEVLLEKDPVGRFQAPGELLRSMPSLIEHIDAQRKITRESLRKPPSAATRAGTRRSAPRLGPKKISVARLPVTGRDVFGRDNDIAFLDAAWANPKINIVTIVAWAGVGKSTLLNHWLGQMAAEHYRSAQLVFGWSFYRQGTSGAASADEFLDAALTWFGDPHPRIGTGWEKGERLAKLIAHRRTLLLLDGLEPLQNPPGPQEGRLREPSIQALLRELAAFNSGLCVITTRLPVADIADNERTSAVRRGLEQLSSDAGAKLLRALGVKGDEMELRDASNEFSGHCLALTLLGSYLTDAYSGDIHCRKEVSASLVHDVRLGAHARKVMESYQAWFGEGPELSVLRVLGLFDRPVDEKIMGVLLKPPAIRGLTESLTDLSPTEWRTVLARLRRGRLLAGEDPQNSGYLDTHPLVREYYGDQLRSQQTEAWEECNKRLFYHYRTVAPQLPDSLTEMEPLFLAVICGCNAGLFHEALHEVYIPRIQRENAFFASNILGARGALLSVLVHFFEHGRWGSPVGKGVEGQGLTAEDQLFILMQAGLYLTATRGGIPEARICYEHAESLSRSLNRSLLLYSALMGQWRYSHATEKLTTTIQIAQRVYSLAQEQSDPAQLVGACNALAGTLYFMGDFESAHQYAARGAQIWRSEKARSHKGATELRSISTDAVDGVQEIGASAVSVLCYEAQAKWHLENIASSETAIAETISSAKEMNDMHGLVVALWHAAVFAYYEGNPAAVERLASELIELSARHHFAHWLPQGEVFRGWARSASGDTTEGISWILEGIEQFRATGGFRGLPFFLALQAEAFQLADRTVEALQIMNEAEALVERLEERLWRAELYRVRGVLLAAAGADETEIEASLSKATRTAEEQKSISLAKRAKTTYAEYHRQKVNALRGRGFRIPLY
jgi:serine/threonine protein kinase/predicted ATPase